MRREGGRGCDEGVVREYNHPMCAHTYTHTLPPMSPVSPSAAGSDQLAEVQKFTFSENYWSTP